MATTLLPQTQHHFNHIPAHYSPAVYEQYTGQHNSELNPLTGIPVSGAEQSLPYTSPPRLATQQVYHRRTSKSPNISDRTPIRHNRPEMSRHRSNTRPQTLLAYAEQQMSQAQAENSSTLYTPSMNSVASAYQGQSYSFPAVTSPYTHQHAYFDTSNTSYMQLPSQQDQMNVVNMYTPGRHDLPLRNTAPAVLNPSETVYSQSRPNQIPSMSPNPAKFPPISQPLESTPNEVDVVNSRQKPQCWEHGCNGRQFSTFSNLLRHQREKSGTATKARCPHCGTEFTRTTARNGHLFGGKCKGLPDSSKDDSAHSNEDKDLKS